MSEKVTCNEFLGGRLKIWQPAEGYRAGTDAVFLAASVPASAGETVLELGCGVGTAALCLGRRVEGIRLTGLEIQSQMAALARRNADENKISLDVVEGDVRVMPDKLKQQRYDHVIANPPYFETKKLTEPSSQAKRISHVAPPGSLADWVEIASKRLAPKGRITLIVLAESLAEILSMLPKSCGAIEIIPIISRANQAAGRVVVTAVKGAGAPLKLNAPKVVHDGPKHIEGRDDYSDWAKGVLRDALPLR